MITTDLAGILETWVPIDGAKFKIKPLTKKERANCLALCSVHTTIGDGYELAWKLGVLDWQDIFDVNGEPIPFEEKYIEAIPDGVWSSVARQVLRINKQGAAEVKN